MQVIFIAPNLSVGGAERQWATLLPALRRRGLSVGCLTLDGRGAFFEELEYLGIPMECADMRGSWDVTAVARAWRRLGGSPGVLMARGTSAEVVALALSRVQGCGLVTTQHSLYGPVVNHSKRTVLMRLVASSADVTIGVSKAQVPGLVALGVPQNRIAVIPNGVATRSPQSPEQRQAARSRLGLRADDVCAVLVARLRPEKRIADFLAAVAGAREQGLPVRGFVAGDGPLLGELQAMAGPGSGVEFLGHQDDVASLYAAADLACLTSSSEVMSMTLLEAMSHGLPIVATAVGGTPELCVPDQTGELVPPGNVPALVAALRGLVIDPERRERLGRGARALQRERFSENAMVDGYMDTLTAVIEEKANRRRVVRRRAGS